MGWSVILGYTPLACAYFESWGSSVAWRWFLRMWPMSWWRWACLEKGACSFILLRPSSLWAEETPFPSCLHLFLRTFQQPNPFCCNRLLAALASTTATLCVSPPFSCVWRLLPSSWFSSASFVLRSLNSVLYSGPSLFLGFLSLVLGLIEQLPLAFSSAWALPPLFFVVCQVPAGGRSCKTTKKRSTTNLFTISFLSRTIDFFFFFLSLWIYLWLAETSQQPISQTTWLKVTPHCNHCDHCNHYGHRTFKAPVQPVIW